MGKRFLLCFSLLFFNNGLGAAASAYKTLNVLVITDQSILQYDITSCRKYDLCLPHGFGLAQDNYLEKVGQCIEQREGRFCCKHCDHDSFPKFSHVKQHVIATHFKVQFGCPRSDCNDRFTRADGIKRHIKSQQHDGDRPHVCGICKRGFGRPDHLSSHMKIHPRQVASSSRATSSLPRFAKKRRVTKAAEKETEEGCEDTDSDTNLSVSDVNPFAPSVHAIRYGRLQFNQGFEHHECLPCSLHTGQYVFFKTSDGSEAHRGHNIHGGTHDEAMAVLYKNKAMQVAYTLLYKDVPKKPAVSVPLAVPAFTEGERCDDLTLLTPEAVETFYSRYNPASYPDRLKQQAVLEEQRKKQSEKKSGQPDFSEKELDKLFEPYHRSVAKNCDTGIDWGMPLDPLPEEAYQPGMSARGLGVCYDQERLEWYDKQAELENLFDIEEEV